MFGLLVGGKIVIMIALAFVALNHLKTAQRGWSVVVLLNWSWILLFGALTIGPIVYAVRLRRVRRKRQQLIYAEWNVD